MARSRTSPGVLTMDSLTPWLLVGAMVCLAAAQHPFITYPLSLWLMKKLKLVASTPVCPSANSQSSAVPPSVSICFCAYNEEKVIAEKIANLEFMTKGYRGPSQILLYTDACADRTAEIARSVSQATQIVEGKERAGKSAGMNRLLSEATGDIVIFTDANVMLAEGTIDAFAAAFSDPEIGCACGKLIYTNSGDSDVATVGSLYWKFEEFLKSLESSTGSTMGADGSLFAIRRNLFRSVAPDIIDDMFTSLSILSDGWRVITISDAVAYEKSATSSSDEFRRKVRIACRCFNCHRQLRSRLWKMSTLNIYKYVSHKYIRWLIVYFLFAGLVLIGIAAALNSLLLLYLLMLITGGLLLLAGGFLFKPVRKLTEILVAFIAVGLGVFHSIRGVRYQTWKPPQSAR